MSVPRVTRLIYVEYLYAFSDWRIAKRAIRVVSFFFYEETDASLYIFSTCARLD